MNLKWCRMVCPALLSATRLLAVIYRSSCFDDFPSALLSPAASAPEGLLGLTLWLPSITLFKSLITQIPPKAPPQTLNSPSLLQQALCSFLCDNRLDHVFFTNINLDSPKPDGSPFRSPVKRAAAGPHSSFHRWMFFQSLLFILRGLTGLILENRVNFLHQLAKALSNPVSPADILTSVVAQASV